MNTVEIVQIREEHAEGFHRALDIVARERRYLSFLEAPPIDATRAFIRDNIDNGFPQLVALADGEVVGWCGARRGRSTPMSACSGWACCQPSGGRG